MCILASDANFTDDLHLELITRVHFHCTCLTGGTSSSSELEDGVAVGDPIIERKHQESGSEALEFKTVRKLYDIERNECMHMIFSL